MPDSPTPLCRFAFMIFPVLGVAWLLAWAIRNPYFSFFDIIVFAGIGGLFLLLMALLLYNNRSKDGDPHGLRNFKRFDPWSLFSPAFIGLEILLGAIGLWLNQGPGRFTTAPSALVGFVACAVFAAGCFGAAVSRRVRKIVLRPGVDIEIVRSILLFFCCVCSFVALGCAMSALNLAG